MPQPIGDNRVMQTQPGRRWFRFSLRTMFIVVTVFACWFGWQTKIVRDRKAALTEARKNPSFHVTTVADWLQWAPVAVQAPETPSVSFVRRWLGDEPIYSISILGHVDGSEAALDRFKNVFPEAQVVERHAEPCHPGCFPHGTLIATPTGLREIESIAVGDLVTTILPAGESTATAVQSIFTTKNRLWQIDTDGGTIITTETQPLCTALTDVVAAGSLKRGDSILLYRDSKVQIAKVIEAAATARWETVVNLVLGNSEVFVADGVLARSKPPAESGSSLE
jgi:hypothetical protein